MCVDWDSLNIDLHGTETDADHTHIDLMFLPCNHRLTKLGALDDRIDDECVPILEEQIKYLGELDLILYYNQEFFAQTEFGDASIERVSVLENFQLDQFRPNWLQSVVSRNLLADETAYIQYGESVDGYYSNYQVDRGPRPSSWSNFPTPEKPFNKYKFNSVKIYFNQDQLMINRQTYSLLEWLGDIGGLFDGLRIIGGVFIAPISSFALDSFLLSSLFRSRKSQSGSNDDDTVVLLNKAETQLNKLCDSKHS